MKKAKTEKLVTLKKSIRFNRKPMYSIAATDNSVESITAILLNHHKDSIRLLGYNVECEFVEFK